MNPAPASPRFPIAGVCRGRHARPWDREPRLWLGGGCRLGHSAQEPGDLAGATIKRWQSRGQAWKKNMDFWRLSFSCSGEAAGGDRWGYRTGACEWSKLGFRHRRLATGLNGWAFSDAPSGWYTPKILVTNSRVGRARREDRWALALPAVFCEGASGPRGRGQVSKRADRGPGEVSTRRGTIPVRQRDEHNRAGARRSRAPW